MKYIYWLILLVMIISFASGILVKKLIIGDGLTIIRTNDGFYPRQLEIKTGQTVRFINKSSRVIWPASNVHPNHTIYPEFDPRGMIEPGKSWQFTFVRDGAFKYHDHLSPYTTGYVYVGVSARKKNNTPCSESPYEQRDNCWDDMIENAFDTGSLRNGLELLGTLFDTDSVFRENGCHQHGHRVGEMIYGKFIKGKDIRKIQFPSASVYCGFGVWHGILEHLFREKADVRYARETCEYLETTFGDTVPGIRLNCVHGLGHGFMQEPPPRETWGKPKEMVKKALLVCEDSSIIKNNAETSQCFQGVFNVLIAWMSEKLYGLSFDINNHFGYCLTFDNVQQKNDCIAEFSMQITRYTKNDLEELVDKYVLQFEDETMQEYILSFAVPSIIQSTITLDDFTPLIRSCMGIAEHLHSSCIRGITGGLMAHGRPGEEYKKGLQTCSSEYLGLDERDACFDNLAYYFQLYYTKDKIQKICALFPEAFQRNCLEKK